MDTFPAMLRRLREARRWSQERLAFAAGINHSLISRIESGQRNPTTDTIPLLCAALGLSQRRADALYLAAFLVPPDLDLDTLAQLIDMTRANETHTLHAAIHLAREARLDAEDRLRRRVGGVGDERRHEALSTTPG